MHRVVPEELGELFQTVTVLAAGDGHRAPLRDLDRGGDEVRRDRRLEPCWLVGGHVLSELEGGVSGEAVVPFDHDAHSRPDGVAYRSDDLHRKVELSPIDRPSGRPERVELGRGVAPPYNLSRLLMAALGGTSAAVPAVCVAAQRVVAAAPDQVVQRLARCLSYGVPAHRLYGRHR